MKVAYFDCFAGASGDMIVGALLDAGVPLAAVQAELAKLPLAGYRLDVRRVQRCGITATKVDVTVGAGPADAAFTEVPAAAAGARRRVTRLRDLRRGLRPAVPAPDAAAHPHPAHGHRPLRAILELLDGSQLTPAVRDLARRVFLRLGQAEARVHGVPLNDVHFHEVGSTDAIVDIVAAAAGLQLLGAEQVLVSAIHVGAGFVRTAHGLYPVPAPATAYLLEGAPVYSTQVRGELITPTGAAILAEAAAGYGPLPALTVQRVGYGAGTREREIPNVLRLVVGEAAAAPGREAVTELLANIDDMNPQFYDYIIERLLAAGALDAWLAPVQMKKNRPGAVLHALCRPEDADALCAIILAESTSIGVRRVPMERVTLERELLPVATPWGTVRVKVARQGGRVVNLAPEYEDCLALARRSGVPLKEVHAAARAAAGHPGGGPGTDLPPGGT